MAITLAFIGGGKMGEALMGGLIGQQWCPAEEIAVVEPSAERRSVLAAAWPGVQMVELADVRDTDVVIAVKPNHVPEVGRRVGRPVDRPGAQHRRRRHRGEP